MSSFVPRLTIMEGMGSLNRWSSNNNVQVDRVYCNTQVCLCAYHVTPFWEHSKATDWHLDPTYVNQLPYTGMYLTSVDINQLGFTWLYVRIHEKPRWLTEPNKAWHYPVLAHNCIAKSFDNPTKLQLYTQLLWCSLAGCFHASRL